MTTYYRYGDTIQDDQGRPIPGAIVTASLYPSGTATIYSDVGGTSEVNGVVSDANGYFEFFAAQGRYTVLITATGLGTITRSPVDLGNTAAGVMGASGTGHAAGLAPDPGASAGTTHYLREDATWVVPPYPTNFAGSTGEAPAAGLVPAPAAYVSGAKKFLREDESWSNVSEPLTTWTDITNFSNGWAGADTATYGTPAYLVDAAGIVHLCGVLQRASGTSGANEVAFTLTSSGYPAKTIMLSMIFDTGASGCYVDNTGVGHVVTAGSNRMHLTGCSYPSAALG